MITFVATVVNSGISPQHNTSSELLMTQCFVAALIGMFIVKRLGPLLRPERIEFESIDEEETE